MRGGFFVQGGLSPSDARSLRRVCIRLCLGIRADLGFVMNLPVSELMEVFREVKRFGKKQRI